MSVHFLTVIKKVISSSLRNKYIYIRYSNGTGNNLFQYYFCYLLKKERNIKIINHFSIYRNMYSLRNRLISYFLFSFNSMFGRNNFLISRINNQNKEIPDSLINIFDDTGEVLEVFQDNCESIKKDFFQLNNMQINNKIYKKRKKIVLHLRLGDRLFRKSDYTSGMFYDFSKLQLIIDKETLISKEYVEIIVVTDSPEIMKVKNYSDFKYINSHTNVSSKDLIDSKSCLSYIKKIQDFIVSNNIKIKKSKNLYEDFYLMVNSDILIFLHGTLAWWAGYLGNQTKVYVSREWRPIKFNNAFLSKYKCETWEKW